MAIEYFSSIVKFVAYKLSGVCFNPVKRWGHENNQARCDGH
jgi:hypothetical protein